MSASFNAAEATRVRVAPGKRTLFFTL